MEASSLAEASAEGLERRVAACDWYHTIELPGGVVTPGFYDCRPIVDRLPWPPSLQGLRVLDVGTWDGFWAYELERRGAAEVVAIDVFDPARWDWPPCLDQGGTSEELERSLTNFAGGSQGFGVAAEALGSRAQRHDVSVYELDPEVHGHFDFVFLGTLLLHLRDPVEALRRIGSVCSGEVLISDVVEAIPSLLRPRTPIARLEGTERPWWWQPNVAALRRMVRSAGLEIVATSPLFLVPRGAGRPVGPLWRAWRQLLTPRGREELIFLALGTPHSAIRARPAGT